MTVVLGGLGGACVVAAVGMLIEAVTSQSTSHAQNLPTGEMLTAIAFGFLAAVFLILAKRREG